MLSERTIRLLRWTAAQLAREGDTECAASGARLAAYLAEVQQRPSHPATERLVADHDLVDGRMLVALAERHERAAASRSPALERGARLGRARLYREAAQCLDAVRELGGAGG